ncbi:unnamed protein product [Aphanomyces euteiches]
MDDSLESNFETAVARALEAQTTHKNLLARQSLQLYGLLQQAHHGDIDTDRPRCPVNYEGKAKWDAWAARRGMTTTAAKEEYTRLVESILPAPPPTSRSSPSQPTRQMKRFKQSTQAPLPRVIAELFVSFIVLVVAMSFVVWASREVDEHCRSSTSHSCDIWVQSRQIRAAIAWISVGLALGSLLHSNLLKWNILSVLYIENTEKAPQTTLPPATPPSSEEQLIHDLGLVMGKVGSATNEHPVMVFSPSEGSSSLGSTRSVMQHPFDAAAGMHFRRFKEPLPDPMQPSLAAIELIEEIPLPQWHCVYRKRKLKIKNNIPAFLKRFASDDFFYLLEESLWDKANEVLYVRGRNESFADLVLVEDFLHFQRHPHENGWSQVTQTGACRIGNAFGFLRSTVQGFVRESYSRSVKRAQDYLVDRLDEEANL